MITLTTEPEEQPDPSKVFEIKLHRVARNYRDRLPENIREDVNDSLRALETNPGYGANIEQMKGTMRGYYRMDLNHGLRAIYRIDHADKKVRVRALGPRGDIYKKGK